MPHQCVKCGKLYKDAAPELLAGCSNCKARFFFYIKQEYYDRLKQGAMPIIELKEEEKDKIESDVREIVGIEEEKPVILDLESVRVLKPGKFELDIVNLFRKSRPIIYKLEEGKYIIDLASTMKISEDEINKKIKDPKNEN